MRLHQFLVSQFEKMLTVLVFVAHFACAFGLLLGSGKMVSRQEMDEMRKASKSNTGRESTFGKLLKEKPPGTQLSGDPNFPYRDKSGRTFFMENGVRRYGNTEVDGTSGRVSITIEALPCMSPACFQDAAPVRSISPPAEIEHRCRELPREVVKLSLPPVQSNNDAPSTLTRRHGTSTADTTAHATPASTVQSGSQSQSRVPRHSSSTTPQSGCSGVWTAVTLAVILYALWCMINSPQSVN